MSKSIFFKMMFLISFVFLSFDSVYAGDRSVNHSGSFVDDEKPIDKIPFGNLDPKDYNLNKLQFFYRYNKNELAELFVFLMENFPPNKVIELGDRSVAQNEIKDYKNLARIVTELIVEMSDYIRFDGFNKNGDLEASFKLNEKEYKIVVVKSNIRYLNPLFMEALIASNRFKGSWIEL